MWKQIFASGIIFIASTILMIVAQLPTPEYLNPIGCFFAIAWIASGMFIGIGTLFMMGNSFDKEI